MRNDGDMPGAQARMHSKVILSCRVCLTAKQMVDAIPYSPNAMGVAARVSHSVP